MDDKRMRGELDGQIATHNYPPLLNPYQTLEVVSLGYDSVEIFTHPILHPALPNWNLYPLLSHPIPSPTGQQENL
ncbi:hypothetical protein EYC84_005454 [Monilinia fructicola]|uniref:Uncharacterized protein n=1 Tax=Monilinia fructicola TaxID=38448 RepID=A0A5M9K0E3_MONFR|nr:hypothetical protein EYC84_005454 [Monilinia fructicola]